MVAPLVGLAIGGGVVSGLSSIFGARSQNKASKRAAKLQRETRDLLLERNEPFRQSQLSAIDSLSQIFGLPGVDGSPGGGFNLDELADTAPIRFLREQGEQAIERASNRAGTRGAGREMFDLVNFNQGLASTGIQNLVLNPLFQLAGLGASGTAATNSAISGAGQNLSNLALNQGNVRSSSFNNLNDVVQGSLNNAASLGAFNSQAGGFTGAGMDLDDLIRQSQGTLF